MGMDDRADPKQPEIEFRIGGKLFDNKSVSFKPRPFTLFLQIFLLNCKFFGSTGQSCFVSTETTDITVTRGTLWSDKV
jgi:hypothetical protein